MTSQSRTLDIASFLSLLGELIRSGACEYIPYADGRLRLRCKGSSRIFTPLTAVIRHLSGVDVGDDEEERFNRTTELFTIPPYQVWAIIDAEDGQNPQNLYVVSSLRAKILKTVKRGYLLKCLLPSHLFPRLFHWLSSLARRPALRSCS